MAMRFTALLAGVLFAIFTAAVVVGEADTETYQDRYVISQMTYKHVVPMKYERIYKAVKRRDASAARTMVDAARDYCMNTVTPTPYFFGPNHTRAFDCTSFGPTRR